LAQAHAPPARQGRGEEFRARSGNLPARAVNLPPMPPLQLRGTAIEEKAMHVQLETDSNVRGTEDLRRRVQSLVEDALGRFGGQITRVEVHLRDENSGKHGARDKGCTLEARLAGTAPVAVHNNADNMLDALQGATDKLCKLLDSQLGRLHDKNRRA
jgi:ribosome-associated translation inhibitor RaiA